MERIRAAVIYEAYDGLSADAQEWLRWMTPNSGNLMVTADVKLQLSGHGLTASGVASSGSNNQSFWLPVHQDEMAPTMLVLIEVPGSRAEVLWGEGTTVSLSQVAHAANL